MVTSTLLWFSIRQVIQLSRKGLELPLMTWRGKKDKHGQSCNLHVYIYIYNCVYIYVCVSICESREKERNQPQVQSESYIHILFPPSHYTPHATGEVDCILKLQSTLRGRMSLVSLHKEGKHKLNWEAGGERAKAQFHPLSFFFLFHHSSFSCSTDELKITCFIHIESHMPILLLASVSITLLHCF